MISVAGLHVILNKVYIKVEDKCIYLRIVMGLVIKGEETKGLNNVVVLRGKLHRVVIRNIGETGRITGVVYIEF